MLLVFKQSVCIDGKDYAKGTHEVPEALLKHKHLLHFIASGMIHEGDEAKYIKPETPMERSQRLLEKLTAAKGLKPLESKAEEKAEEAFDAPVADEESADEEGEELEEGDEVEEADEAAEPSAAPKKKKKKSKK